jgi:putative ABC transport system permease protein
MLNKVLLSVSVAWQNIKANPLHTLLSTLGIIIGVAALVTILSLADGMEKLAREQISRTTSLKAIIVQSETRKQIDSVWVNLDTFPIFRAGQVAMLRDEFSSFEHVLLSASGTTVFTVENSEQGVGGYFEAVEGEARTRKEKFGGY